MKSALYFVAALAALTLSTAAYAGGCVTDTPVTKAQAVDAWNGGPATHLAGTATCEDNNGEMLAVAAALSTPIWLEPGEKFAVSGGLGFSGDGDTAVGATGVVRIDKGISGFAGGAMSTDDTDLWSGKVGIRAGF